ncbi:AAA family ATPase [Polynucleobacter paneuropaeus]|nr:AAA family ATPase [Polynucleobacter paneuropaeus]
MDDSPQAVTLKSLRGLISDGITNNKLEEVLIKINQNLNEPPLSDDQVRKIIFKELRDQGHAKFIDAAPIKLDLADGQLSYVSNSPRRQFLFGYDIIPMNTLSVLAGLGGGGKTQAVIQMMVASATGESYAERSCSPTCSMLLGFEDSREEINARFSATMEYCSADQRALVEKNVRAISLIGADFQLVTLKGRIPETTGYADLLIQKMIELKSLTGLARAMLVIDHARLVAMIDMNDAAQTTILTRELHRIASEAEAAVVLIAHSPKSTGAADHEISQADVAGSSALVDNARYVAIIKGMTAAEAKKLGINEDERNNYVNFESVKSNYSPKGKVGWFKKSPCPNHHVATHQFVKLNKPIISRIGDTSEEAKVIKYVRANPDLSYTDLRARAGKKTDLGLSDNQLMVATNGLLEKGLLKYVMPSIDYSKKITPNFKGVLVVANEI